ncbi:MAG: NAD-dependent DNA ligase LigA [Acidimicrobiales bacterium]
MDHNDFVELTNQLRSAARAYYAGDGSQLIDDASYDVGIRKLQAAAVQHGWTDADDLLTQVAGGQAASDGVPHEVPMLSLDNAMNDAELQAFFDRVAHKTGITPEDLAWVVEPKFDGMALSVRYHDGLVAQILTRGNGLVGESVVGVARYITGIPAVLPHEASVTVVGECVMTHEDFAEANQMRLEHGERPFANPRNAVAGSLRAKNRDYRVPMTFIAYGAHAPAMDPAAYTTDPMPERYSMTISRLHNLGFVTAADVVGNQLVAKGSVDAVRQVARIEEQRHTFPMDTDGAVLKADNPHVRETMGEGSRSPRWAIARKFAPDTRETDLLDIEVAVGRTGNLSFTAKVTPVAVGGTTISSATVHNVSEIARKGLRLPGPGGGIAQRVVVRRAGEVIPEIVGVADASPGEDETSPFVPPTQCPNGHALDTTGIIWSCVLGRDCTISAGICYAVSRDCLDVEGMGPQIVDALASSGVVSDVADLFELTIDRLLAVPRLGRANANKILAQIDKARTLPLARIVTALGVRGTGRAMSRRITQHFQTLDAIRAATVEQMAQVEGIGPIKAPSIVEELVELASVLDRLEAMGIGSTKSDAPIEALSLADKSVCVTGAMTGALAGMSRNEVNELIESLGGRAASSVSAKTSLLLTDNPDSGTGKAKKARELGVEIVSPNEFAERYMGGTQ